MTYYNIHTHKNLQEKDTISILNYNAGDFSAFCGLDLQHTLYSLGLHPWKIRAEDWAKNIDYIEKNAIFKNIKAIGECGLDKHCHTPWELQMKVFTAQIKISENIQKPLIIHCVKAFDEVIAFKKEFSPGQPWIIHGFRGKPEQARQLIKQGFFLSFGPNFNDMSLIETPLDRLFLETDDSEESIRSVYEKTAKVLGMNIECLTSHLENNLKHVFF